MEAAERYTTQPRHKVSTWGAAKASIKSFCSFEQKHHERVDYKQPHEHVLRQFRDEWAKLRPLKERSTESCYVLHSMYEDMEDPHRPQPLVD